MMIRSIFSSPLALSLIFRSLALFVLAILCVNTFTVMPEQHEIKLFNKIRIFPSETSHPSPAALRPSAPFNNMLKNLFVSISTHFTSTICYCHYVDTWSIFHSNCWYATYIGITYLFACHAMNIKIAEMIDFCASHHILQWIWIKKGKKIS